MNAEKLKDKVKFQPPGASSCCDAWIAWAAGDVIFLHVQTVAGGMLVRLDVEVAQKSEDGIFRRAEKYSLDKEAEDVLRTLRELAETFNSLDL